MWLLIPICIIILYPLIRFYIKRVVMLFEIKHICRLNSFKYKANHFGVILGNFKWKNFDFYIETPNKVYSVKLCGMYFKMNLCDFRDAEHYAIRTLAFQLPHTKNSIEYKVKTKPAYNFRYRFAETYYTKELIPIILMNPVSINTTYNKQGVGNSDFISEGYFYTNHGFLEKLRSE